jgi:hypothetical protein
MPPRGYAPLQAYNAAMPGWKSDIRRRGHRPWRGARRLSPGGWRKIFSETSGNFHDSAGRLVLQMPDNNAHHHKIELSIDHEQ